MHLFSVGHSSFVIRILWLSTSIVVANVLRALTIESDFEGASVRVVQSDEATQTVRFMPGGDPKRGCPCWWYFRISGIDPSKPLTLELQASDLPMPQANGVPSNKPLGGERAMADRASYSTDGRKWTHPDPGRNQDGRMTPTLKPADPLILVAWGPP